MDFIQSCVDSNEKQSPDNPAIPERRSCTCSQCMNQKQREHEELGPMPQFSNHGMNPLSILRRHGREQPVQDRVDNGSSFCKGKRVCREIRNQHGPKNRGSPLFEDLDHSKKVRNSAQCRVRRQLKGADSFRISPPFFQSEGSPL